MMRKIYNKIKQKQVIEYLLWKLGLKTLLKNITKNYWKAGKNYEWIYYLFEDEKNLEEKKKTGFFSMLSNLMSSSEKEKKNEADVSVTPEKKQKIKKQKTDPNLFLFNDVVDNNSSINEDNSLEEISTISDDGQDSALDEDIDTPSYLRKGTGH